jgi:hypothetical protein
MVAVNSSATTCSASQRPPTVLIVESDVAKLARLTAVIRTAGFDVVLCSGPPLRDGYTCPGGRGEPCQIAQHADAVVLGGDLPGEALGEGVTAGDLALYYESRGTPVIAIDHIDSWLSGRDATGRVVLPARWRPRDLLVAVTGSVVRSHWDGEGTASNRDASYDFADADEPVDD